MHPPTKERQRAGTTTIMKTNVKALPATLALLLSTGCAPGGTVQSVGDAHQVASQDEAQPVAADDLQTEQRNLQTFDDLDFNVFSHQKWDRLAHSHAQDVIVHWPDGRTTVGIDTHIADLKKLFVYAPDTRIKVHPHKIADRNMTAVSGIMEGTFTRPMPLGDGSSMPATGKRFTLPMATIGRWEGGVMQEEWLYWDSQSYLVQIGAAP
jgi:hypothetical protein